MVPLQRVERIFVAIKEWECSLSDPFTKKPLYLTDGTLFGEILGYLIPHMSSSGLLAQECL